MGFLLEESCVSKQSSEGISLPEGGMAHDVYRRKTVSSVNKPCSEDPPTHTLAESQHGSLAEARRPTRNRI